MTAVSGAPDPVAAAGLPSNLSAAHPQFLTITFLVSNAGPTCVIGFNPYSHAWFADRFPGVLRGLDSWSWLDKDTPFLSPEQRKACTPDVYRLCAGEIPSAPKITACLRAKKASLSPACAAALSGAISTIWP